MSLSPSRLILLVFLGALTAVVRAADPTPAPSDAVRIACIGDTITDMSNYPKVLAQFLAVDYPLARYHEKSYDVRNFGVPDTTVVQTEKPWINTAKAAEAKAYLPQIVIIEIGTQDTQKGKNWNAISTFVPEYKKLVSEFAALPSKPKIYLCLPPPIYGTDGWGMSEENLTSTVIPGIKQVAKEMNLPLIDLHTALGNRPDLFHNSVHPVGEARKYIAAAVYTGIFGIDPPGALMAAPTVFPGKNLLASSNPGAESASPGWVNKGGKFAFVSNPVHGGEHAALFSDRAADTDSLGIDITAALAAGGPGDYCFRAFARLFSEPVDKKRPQCWIILTVTDGKGTRTITGPRQDITAKDWIPCGGTGSVTWTGTLQSATLWVAGTQGQNFILDDFELCKFIYTPPGTN